LYVNVESGLIDKLAFVDDAPSKPLVEESFSDYRDVDGIKIPSRLRISSSVQNVTITLKEIEQNVEVDPTLFSKPAGR
jgi:hypothetical protein